MIVDAKNTFETFETAEKKKTAEINAHEGATYYQLPRVARFFSVNIPKRGKYIPNYHKLHIPNCLTFTKWP
jgi:hypothetical protein